MAERWLKVRMCRIIPEHQAKKDAAPIGQVSQAALPLRQVRRRWLSGRPLPYSIPADLSVRVWAGIAGMKAPGIVWAAGLGGISVCA